MPLPFNLNLRELQNLSPQQWTERLSRTLPRGVFALLIIAIAWQLVQLTWLVIDQTSEAAPLNATSIPSPMPSAADGSFNVQSVIDRHLFGVANAKTEASPEDAPPIQANLVLAGLWTEEGDPKQGYAMIGESTSNIKTYGVGETVRPGTTLYAVYSDRAILDTGGKLEKLVLPRASTPETAFTPPVQAAAPVGGQFTDNLRRIAETNPTMFAEIVRPQPVFANGVQKGYRVYPGRNRQQFAKLGLEPGDLVLSINGTPLDDPQRGMEIFNTMGSADQVSVTVERGGQTQELTLNTGLISLPGGGNPAAQDGGRVPQPPPQVMAPLE
jgi:general secretion pathway protein C